MILIFGGAYQGKLDYALERFGLSDEDAYKCDYESVDMPEGKKIIYEIDKWILALIKSDINPAEPLETCIGNNPGAVVICNDISCGVVPVEPLMRKWREAVGRALAVLARASDETVRVFCGIPARIK